MNEPTTDPIADLQRLLLGAAEFTSEEVAASAGVDLEHAQRLYRALGFAPVDSEARIFSGADVEILRAAAALVESRYADAKVLLQLTRVTGQSMARLAEAQVTAVAHRFDAVTSSPTAVAAALVSAEPILRSLEPFHSYVWRRHLLAALRRSMGTRVSEAGGGGSLAVGFADLVGFTAISQQLDDTQLAALVERFEEVAYECVPRHGGRVIKMIGDEVMFAADGAEAAARISLDLVAAYSGDDQLPEIRVGLAFGPTLAWQGDIFGPTVNLASRLVNIARPGTVLISHEAAALLEAVPWFLVRRLSPLRLKGLGKVSFAVLRPAPPPVAPSPTRSERSKARREKKLRDAKADAGDLA